VLADRLDHVQPDAQHRGRDHRQPDQQLLAAGEIGDHQRGCLWRPVEPGCGAGLGALALASPLTVGGTTPGETATGGVITGGTPAGALVVGTGGGRAGGARGSPGGPSPEVSPARPPARGGASTP